MITCLIQRKQTDAFWMRQAWLICRQFHAVQRPRKNIPTATITRMTGATRHAVNRALNAAPNPSIMILRIDMPLLLLQQCPYYLRV